MTLTQFLGFLVAIALLALLTGCEARMHVDEAQWAADSCLSKGGLAIIQRTGTLARSDVTAECKNGESVRRKFSR